MRSTSIQRLGLPLLLILLFLKTLLLLFWITFGPIGLGPDEAQYWTWSQDIDWGYYSKPPGIAWQIWLTTHLLGNSELGVRLGALAIGLLLPFAVYAMAAACQLQQRTCLAAAAIFALTPVGMMASFLAITDGGLVLFFASTTALFAYALSHKTAPNYYALGMLILLGALFKWPIYLFWPFAILWLLWQGHSLNRHLFGGIALSLLGLLPSFLWNSQHDWATFRHVLGTVYVKDHIEVGTTQLMQGNFGDFIGAQALLLSPLLFLCLIITSYALFRHWRELSAGLQFTGTLSLLLLASYTSVAAFKKMQGNWADFAYPGAVILICWFLCERVKSGRRWLIAAVSLSILQTTLLLAVPLLQSHSIPSCCHLPFKGNPFKHNLGWHNLKGLLKEAGYDPHEHFLFADRYQTSSILSFYGPDQKRAYFFNLHQIRKNQFSYWPGMESREVGKNAYFVLIENTPHLEFFGEEALAHTQTLLKPYFSEVEFIGLFPLFYSYGKIVKCAYLFKCHNYNGLKPPETLLY